MTNKMILVMILLLIGIGLTATPFRDGEKLVFTVRYGVVNAAEATIETNGTSFQGVPVWHLKISARTQPFFDPFFKIRDRVESWWRKDNLLPLKFSKNLQEGNYRQYRIHTYNHRANTTTYQKYAFRQETFITEEMPLVAGSQDILSAFFWVRHQSLTPGRSVFVHITADGRSMRTEVKVHRRETIDTIFGRKQCLVIEPKLAGEAVFKQSGRILIWLTDDEYKIPVKLDSAVSFGSFVATLSSAQNVGLRIP
ncbi:MAG: hypothetical protein CVU49_02445 [Candidatus Cloacimonetes bacterium HGW-Cloacimonetes-2]|nr:MAG: hypothetical protein CVU49_02445 [Candidatus Cloacimonetes bacterium HGW-Cloacimonetes-2]